MISVCTPYWNRPESLARMFQCYARWYPELELEFSICDDGSPRPATVPAGTILTMLPQKDHPLNPCVPINRAVQRSTGEVIVLTNPEIEHTSPILAEMYALLRAPEDYVIARCWDASRDLWLAGPEVDYRFGGRMPVPPGGHFHFCVMFRRELWTRAGGFDEDYRHGQGCDDNDWLWRLYAVGARFLLTTQVVRHYHLSMRWGLPFNQKLFLRKWPPARRAALVAARTGTPSTW